MHPKYLLVLVISIFCSCGQSDAGAEHYTEADLKDTCADPDAPLQCNFIGMPDDIGPVVTIAPANEPGERMVISGHIYKADGKTPMSDVSMYLHHTDNTGIYSKKVTKKAFRPSTVICMAGAEQMQMAITRSAL